MLEPPENVSGCIEIKFLLTISSCFVFSNFHPDVGRCWKDSSCSKSSLSDATIEFVPGWLRVPCAIPPPFSSLKKNGEDFDLDCIHTAKNCAVVSLFIKVQERNGRGKQFPG